MTIRLPAWLQNGSYNAELDRTVATGLLAPFGSLGARGGVRRWAGDELQVLATSPATMQVTVKAGMAWIRGGFTAVQGTYVVVNDEDVVLTVTTASAANARIDRVILEVLDSAYTGSDNLGRLRVVTGTPSSDPAPPAVGGSHIVLAEIRVTQNATSIGTAAITDKRSYASSIGGNIPVKNAAERESLTGVPIGDCVVEVDTRRVYIRNSHSSWEYVYGGTPPMEAITPEVGWYNWTAVKGGGPWEDLRVTRINGIVHVTGLLGNYFGFSNPGTMFTLPVGYRPQRRKLIRVDTGSGARERVDIYQNGKVIADPGGTHVAHDWWVIDITMNITNNSIG